MLSPRLVRIVDLAETDPLPFSGSPAPTTCTFEKARGQLLSTVAAPHEDIFFSFSLPTVKTLCGS